MLKSTLIGWTLLWHCLSLDDWINDTPSLLHGYTSTRTVLNHLPFASKKYRVVGWSASLIWFFALICCKNCIVCLKRLQIIKNRLEMAHFYKDFAYLTYFSSPLFSLTPVGLKKSPMKILVLKEKCSRRRFFTPRFSRYWNTNESF